MNSGIEYQPKTKSDFELWEEYISAPLVPAQGEKSRKPEVVLIKGSSLTPEPVRWLWPNWINIEM